MTWDEMTPRQRGALVAEKVMSWVAEHTYYVKADDQKFMVGHRILEWRPSTNISAAWEVVEKMRELSHPQQELFHDHTNYTLFNITPEVICKAALNAVGVSV